MIPEAYARFGDRLPPALWRQLDALGERLARLDHPARVLEQA